MTSLVARTLRLAEASLQYVALPILWVGSLATPVLRASAWCGARAREAAAREWNPRLWDRNGDPRADNEDRRP